MISTLISPLFLFLSFNLNVRASAISPEAACGQLVESYGVCNQGMEFEPKSGLVSISPYAGRVPCTDEKKLPFFERLNHPDFASQLSIAYVAGVRNLPNHAENDDGGRIRFDQLFKTVYGGSADEVRRNLVRVRFLNQVILFNGKNGAASALASVGEDLLRAIKSDTVLAKYLSPWTSKTETLNGTTFNWRKVAPTERLSNHSFGAAIDLNDPHALAPVYWLWDLAAQRQRDILKKTGKKIPIAQILKSIREEETSDFKPTRLSPTPRRLVDIFEKHGFIWGGKWFHFDSMHFEYRPEFFPKLVQSCLVPLSVDDPLTDDVSAGMTSEDHETLMQYHWD